MADDLHIILEGSDDWAAVAEIVAPARRGVRKRQATWNVGKKRAALTTAEGKGNLAQAVADAVTRIGTTPAIAVVFDPDDTTKVKDFEFMARPLRRALKAVGSGSGSKKPHGYAVKFKGETTQIHAAPWRTEPEATEIALAGLPDDHCLERILIRGILASPIDSAQCKWAKKTTTSLLKMDPSHGWKRAFRIWNAALHPDTDVSFVDALLQRGSTVSACKEALEHTAVARILRDLLK